MACDLMHFLAMKEMTETWLVEVINRQVKEETTRSMLRKLLHPNPEKRINRHERT